MSTLVIPLLGELPTILGTSVANSSWVVTVTLLSGAVATPVTGRLGDMYGARRILLLCTIPLIIGSVLCALSSSLVPMLVGRALQGAGFGMVPVGISALRTLVPPEKLGSSIAVMSASLGIGGTLGLPLAAVVAQTTSWRFLFWGVAALSVLTAVLIAWVVPSTPAYGAGKRFDAVGAFGVALGLVCLLLAVSKGADWGWVSPTTLALLAGAIVVLLIWGLWELRTDAPLIDLRVSMGKRVLVTNAVTILIGFSAYFQSLLVPQLRQLPEATGYGLGQSMVMMGLWCAPAGMAMMAVAPLSARLTATRGPRVTLLTGCLCMATGFGSSPLLMGSTWGLMFVSCSVAAGLGLAYGAVPTLILSSVPQSEGASANSVNTLLRSVGSSTSAAVSGMVLGRMSVEFAGSVVPSEAGFVTGLMIGGVTALVAAATTMLIRVPKPGSGPAHESHVPERATG
ncbi:MFS transporter [Rhodococcus sp. SJ-2]